MRRYEAEIIGIGYYRYMIAHGIPIRGEMMPARDHAGSAKDNANFYSDEADICLNCVRPKCSGSQRCYRNRLEETLAAKRASRQNAKEVVK